MQRLSLQLRAYWLAQQFLTRIPTPGFSSISSSGQAHSALFYPLVGFVIGAILVFIAWLLAVQPALVGAAIIIAVWAGITGALHLDGLADSADAWLGGQGDLEKTHTILKDPRVGTAALVTVSVILLLKFSALVTHIEHQQLGVILLSPIIGRAMILLLFLSTDYVREQGLGNEITKGLNRQAATIIVILVLMISALISFSSTLCVLLGFVGLRHLMIKHLRGCTGDTTGALVEISEALWLIASTIAL